MSRCRCTLALKVFVICVGFTPARIKIHTKWSKVLGQLRAPSSRMTEGRTTFLFERVDLRGLRLTRANLHALLHLQPRHRRTLRPRREPFACVTSTFRGVGADSPSSPSDSRAIAPVF